MASLELINLRLKLAANILDGAASDIRDADYQPRSENILKIGCALAEIFEIQHRIYVTHPHLMPAYLSKKAMHSEMDKLLTRYMYVALWPVHLNS
ncbi:hypothetical protein G7048_08975 [Diaphorobacter sp. HDW4B]|uniref:hypothetical protein n=1 Tax=Diaphorobacter sp. HDW4B TaxID=2714925 RepID=UPI001407C1E3|nr:hypothetical protein [Diaphorobacter sp. HDW4B]QIL70471.1 hypothetical protein G7048_08975 [Diaphorobacter sp. HDW4B]